MKPARKREMVDDIRRAWQVSIRSACQALPVDRSTYHYRPKRSGQAVLMKRIKEIAETRVRYGYRRIHVLLRREGWLVNSKRVCRLYREMGLQLRHKTPKRRVKAKLRRDRRPATRSNETWVLWISCMISWRDWNEAAGSDDHRYVFPLLAGNRAAVQMPAPCFLKTPNTILSAVSIGSCIPGATSLAPRTSCVKKSAPMGAQPSKSINAWPHFT